MRHRLLLASLLVAACGGSHSTAQPDAAPQVFPDATPEVADAAPATADGAPATADATPATTDAASAMDDAAVVTPDAAKPVPDAHVGPDADTTPDADPRPAVCGDGIREVGEQCDDGGTAPGDGCGPTCLKEQLPYTQNFDTGTSDLTTTTSSATVVWGVVTDQSASSPDSLWLGDPATGTYNDGNEVIATATTPYVPIGAAGLTVSANIYLDTEASWDTLTVEIVDPSGNVVQTLDSMNGSSGGVFVRHAWAIEPAGVSYVALRFSFDTKDGISNSYPGFFLDDLSITAAACGDGVVNTLEVCDGSSGCPAGCGTDCAPGSGANAQKYDFETGTCFFAYSTPADRTSAEATCVAAGGHLASIHDAHQNTLVDQLLGVPVFFGASDVAQPGTWAYPDGTPFDYTAWGTSEPSGATHCAVARADGTWADGACATATAFVCALDPVLYIQDFDSGTSDLTTATSSATVVWYLATNRAASAPSSLHLADPASNTYSDGSEIIASATTPTFVVPSGGATIAYRLDKITEQLTNWDQFFAEVIDSGGNVIASQDVFAFDLTTFPLKTFSVPSSAAGQTLSVRFRFDTYDGGANSFEGIYLDDISVRFPVCGDGAVNDGESCDDGNFTNGDGCENDCTPTPCPTPIAGADANVWDAGRNVCLGYFATALDATSAESACGTAGGHLVSIHGDVENAIVGSAAPGTDVLIGATDAASEGTFVWTDTTALDYTNWAPGEPGGSTAENCAERYAAGTWNDVACTGFPLGYVCEVPE